MGARRAVFPIRSAIKAGFWEKRPNGNAAKYNAGTGSAERGNTERIKLVGTGNGTPFGDTKWAQLAGPWSTNEYDPDDRSGCKMELPSIRRYTV